MLDTTPAINGRSASALPWHILADAARALALTHHGLIGGSGGSGVGRSSGAGQGEDAEKLGAAAEAMGRAAEKAKAYKGKVLKCPRHVCELEGGEGTRKVYQVRHNCVFCLLRFCCC